MGERSLVKEKGGREEELFRIVDEDGKDVMDGSGLSVGRVALPMGVVCGVMLGVGVAAGVPLGMGAGRAEGDGGSGGRKGGKGLRAGGGGGTTELSPAQLADGARWALRALGYGTLLCAAMGVVGVVGIRHVYQVDSIQEFGERMREIVPKKRRAMEQKLDPVLTPVRRMARSTLPDWFATRREAVLDSRMGRWIASRVRTSTDYRAHEKGEKKPEGA